MTNKKRKKREFGFSATEFLTVMVVATILLAILLSFALDIAQKEKYRVMQYNATLFGYSASSFALEEGAKKVYLQELIDDKMFVSIKNPFSGDKYCDSYQSFIEFEDDKKYVTLRCGDYLIDHQDMLEETIPIYQVSEWTTKKIKEKKNVIIEEKVLYNYLQKNKEVFPVNYPEDTFLFLFNKAYHSSYEKVKEIPNTYDIVKNTYYRSKTIVAER